MRVIAGSCRGRRLRSPGTAATRPTSGRVRGAVFDLLQGVVDLDGAHVADLFAGSGALGIEALSRGAAHADFVDRDPAAVAAVRANLATCGFAAGAATVRRDDVLRFLARRPPERRYQLALCDPPYAFDAWAELLGHLPADVAVLETDRDPTLAPGWEIIKSRPHGGTLIVVVRPTPQKGSP